MTLYVYSLRDDLSLTHTSLTRAHGVEAGLPPFAEWFGLEALDTDRIELFPISDLGGMALSQYLFDAHDVDEAGLAEAAADLDALTGTVLLIPQTAMTGGPQPATQAQMIAALPFARRNDQAVLPKTPATVEPMPGATPPERRIGALPWVVGVALILAALLVWVVS